MRQDSPEWIAAKAEGDRAEMAIAKWFQGRGWQTYKTIGRVDFDLLLQCEVEVKRDLQAPHTGNVAIETDYRGNPSGIMVSKATWWVIVLDVEAVIVKRDDLLHVVMSGKFREVAAGDGQAAKVRLVPVARLKAIRGACVITLPEEALGDT
jgi:hypothetical protein